MQRTNIPDKRKSSISKYIIYKTKKPASHIDCNKLKTNIGLLKK